MHMMHSISLWLDASHSQFCRHPLCFLSLHHSVDEVVRGCQVHSAVLQPLCIFDRVRLVVSLSLSSSPYLHSLLFSYCFIPTFIIIVIISSFITHPSLALSFPLSFLFSGSIPFCTLLLLAWMDWQCCCHSFEFSRISRPIENLREILDCLTYSEMAQRLPLLQASSWTYGGGGGDVRAIKDWIFEITVK